MLGDITAILTKTVARVIHSESKLSRYDSYKSYKKLNQTDTNVSEVSI